MRRMKRIIKQADELRRELEDVRNTFVNGNGKKLYKAGKK